MKSLKNVFHLGIKELRGLRHDTVMLLLVVYTFSYGVYGPASGTGTELRNGSIAVVDEDRSQSLGCSSWIETGCLELT